MNRLKRHALLFFTAVFFIACQSNDESSPSGPSGRIKLLATDAPFNYENVSGAGITISKIELRNKNGGGFITLSNKVMTLDLIELKNGLTETLTDLDVPVGEYDHIRLVIDDASVGLKDGRRFDLDVPSGASSGLKIFIDPTISVTSRGITELLLDFDLSRSFVAVGTAQSIQGFTFSPVIRASNLATSGTISGHVTGDPQGTPADLSDDVALSGSLITISKADGTVVGTAVTDENGFYKVLGIQEGTNYSITGALDGYITEDFYNLSVVTGNETKKNMVLGLDNIIY